MIDWRPLVDETGRCAALRTTTMDYNHVTLQRSPTAIPKLLPTTMDYNHVTLQRSPTAIPKLLPRVTVDLVGSKYK